MCKGFGERKIRNVLESGEIKEKKRRTTDVRSKEIRRSRCKKGLEQKEEDKIFMYTHPKEREIMMKSRPKLISN